MRHATLCFPFENTMCLRVLLGHKKTGLGAGKYVGIGGGIEAGETPEAAAIRELAEESRIKASEDALHNAGRVTFFFPAKPSWDHRVHIFLVDEWQGDPIETAELKPVWYTIGAIPYKQMWPDAMYWLPSVLNERKIEAKFIYNEDNATIAEHSVQILN